MLGANLTLVSLGPFTNNHDQNQSKYRNVISGFVYQMQIGILHNFDYNRMRMYQD